MSEDQDQAKQGRPTLYRPEYCEMLVAHMKGGLSFECFAAVIDVHPDTVYEWVKVHESFSEAKRVGKIHERLFWERLARGGAAGQLKRTAKTVTHRDGRVEVTEEPTNANAALIIFALKNKFPKEWRDRKDLEISGKDGGPIKTEVSKGQAIDMAKAFLAETTGDGGG